MKKSNRYLAKRYKNLNQKSFCQYSEGNLRRLSCIKSFYFDIHDIYPTPNNYVYRAIINNRSTPCESIARIAYNPNPTYLSRANLVGQGVGYYACASDISIIEACQDNLKSTNTRYFELTVSKWKVRKVIPVQIICHSKQPQSVGTDLMDFYTATRDKRKQELTRGVYRSWFLKMKFISDQYAKTNIKCERDYYLSGWHAKSFLRHPNIKGIIYPSVPYRYIGFNYAFSPDLFHDSSLELEEVFHYTVQFDNRDIKKYPNITLVKSTKSFDKDKIIW